MRTLKMTRVSSILISPTPTFQPNSPVSTSNQNNPTTTKLSKSLKKVMRNKFTLRNAMHPLMISLTKLQECQPQLMKFRQTNGVTSRTMIYIMICPRTLHSSCHQPLLT